MERPTAMTIFFLLPGSGGGGGGGDYGVNPKQAGPVGGRGGGAVHLVAGDVVVSGLLTSDGAPGVDANKSNNARPGGGGGGSGGSISLRSLGSATLGSNTVHAQGGAGGAGGEASNLFPRGRMVASASSTRMAYPARRVYLRPTMSLRCAIVEQVESLPYDHGLLWLPQSCAGSCFYSIQYGRRYLFTGSGQSDPIDSDSQTDLHCGHPGCAGQHCRCRRPAI